MKTITPHILLMALLALTAASCTDDDSSLDTLIEESQALAASTSPKLNIVFSEAGAVVSGNKTDLVTVSGAHVVLVDTLSKDSLTITLSGNSNNGSLLVWRKRKYTIVLDNVTLTNPTGPAINNQRGKSLFVVCPDGTENALSSGQAFNSQDYDQKATLFSEGQVYLKGSGKLSVEANNVNAIASDDYLTISGDIVLNVNSTATATNGLKANDGIFINGGTTTIAVAAKGARGIRSESVTVVTGGTTTITTTGDCLEEESVDDEGHPTSEFKSCACIKSDSTFTMTGGTLTMKSTGDGGKGLNCSQDITISGGSLTAVTEGGNENSKPKAVKSDTAITISGGSLYAKTQKSWACDNGAETEEATDDEDEDEKADSEAYKKLTVVGTPSVCSIKKKEVTIAF